MENLGAVCAELTCPCRASGACRPGLHWSPAPAARLEDMFPWGQLTALQDFPLVVLSSAVLREPRALMQQQLLLVLPSAVSIFLLHPQLELTVAEQQLPALPGKGVLVMLDQCQRQGTPQENRTSNLFYTSNHLSVCCVLSLGVCANQKTQAEEL